MNWVILTAVASVVMALAVIFGGGAALIKFFQLQTTQNMRIASLETQVARNSNYCHQAPTCTPRITQLEREVKEVKRKAADQTQRHFALEKDFVRLEEKIDTLIKHMAKIEDAVTSIRDAELNRGRGEGGAG